MNYTLLKDAYPPKVGQYRVFIVDQKTKAARNCVGSFDGAHFYSLGTPLNDDERVEGWSMV